MNLREMLGIVTGMTIIGLIFFTGTPPSKKVECNDTPFDEFDLFKIEEMDGEIVVLRKLKADKSCD